MLFIRENQDLKCVGSFKYLRNKCWSLEVFLEGEEKQGKEPVAYS